MSPPDPASLITSVAALIAAAGGIWTASRGRRDANTQQAAANVVEKKASTWDQSQQIIDDLRTEASRAYRARDRERDRADRAEDEVGSLRQLIDDHEPWDRARRHDQPDAPPAPPLRPPRPRSSND